MVEGHAYLRFCSGHPVRESLVGEGTLALMLVFAAVREVADDGVDSMSLALPLGDVVCSRVRVSW